MLQIVSLIPAYPLMTYLVIKYPELLYKIGMIAMTVISLALAVSVSILALAVAVWILVIFIKMVRTLTAPETAVKGN